MIGFRQRDHFPIGTSQADSGCLMVLNRRTPVLRHRLVCRCCAFALLSALVVGVVLPYVFTRWLKRCAHFTVASKESWACRPTQTGQGSFIGPLPLAAHHAPRVRARVSRQWLLTLPRRLV